MIYEDLCKYLKAIGATLVGFADLSEIDASLRNNMEYGISLAVKLNPDIIKNIKDGPTMEYYEEYQKVNKILDYITIECVKYIKRKGYNAIGQTTTYVTNDDKLITSLPHKTVATRAGIGWIGKNALLVTKEYGSAIRLSSVITDMPLSTNTPINKSNCGSCTKCTEACPASAIKGSLWKIDSKREELIEPYKCRKKARALLNKRIGVESAICGKCIEVCPFTIQYIEKSIINRI